MLNLDSVTKEIKQLEQLQIRLVAAIRKSPAGTIYYRKISMQVPLPYMTTGTGKERKRTRLDPTILEHRQLIRQLKDKKFARHILPRVRNNLIALRAALKYVPLSRSFLTELGEEYDDCLPRFFGDPTQKDDFDMLEERQNPYHPEQMNVCDELGAFRSKNELLTAHVLDDLQLRFKYEAPLYTPYGVKYPDFTLLHPVTGQLYYIEIAGRMDDPEYRRDLYNKMEAYAEAGIYQGVNLLVICIDPNKGIDLAAIKELIRGFFAL